MATVIQQRRGTKAQHDDGAGFTGAVGEITVDTTDDTLRVHDGSLKGGHVIAKLSDVEASDTLAEMSDVNLTSPADGSVLKYDNASSKWIDSAKLTETATGIDVTGAVTVSGTVDGRDIAADGILLDAIEAGADVTDTANVVAALTAGTNITIAGDGTISSTDTNTTYSVQDGELSQNNFTNDDHDKLNEIEASADVTDTANVVAALTAGTNISIAGNGTISATDTNTTYSVQDGELSRNNFTDDDHTKLNGIEAGADVTDSTNVVAALTAGTNISIAGDGTISATDTNTTYTGGTGLTLDGTTFNVDAAQTGITSLGTLSGLTTGATTVNGPLIATNDYHQFRSTNTNTSAMPLIEVFRDKEITAAGSNPLGGFVFTGLNEDDRKVSYGSFSCNSTFQYDDGEHKASLVFTVADGSGAVDPFSDYTNGSYKSGHSVALNIGADFFITNGYIRSDSGELKLGSKQSIKDSAEAFNDQGTYDLHMPNATKAKVISIGGIGPFDSFITGNQTAAQMIRYRGQHMLMVAGGALEFDLPACAASADISATTCNVGDIFQISNAAGGALTIDRDGSGTAQTVYHFPSLTLTPFTNNPTLAVGGTMMLQAVAANTWMVFNPTGLTDA